MKWTTPELVRADVTRALTARLRSGLVACVAATLVVLVLDLLSTRQLALGALAPRLAILALLLVLWRVSRKGGWITSVSVSLAMIAAYSALFAGIGAAEGRTILAGYMLIALAMCTAAYLPWGGGPQAISAALILLALTASAMWSSAPQPWTETYFPQFAIVLVVSVLVARELHRQTVARVEEALARRDRERSLNEEATVSAALVRVGREMLSVADSPDLLERLCRLTAEILATDSSHAFVIQPQDNTYCCIAGYGDTPEQIEVMRVLRIPADLVQPLANELDRRGLLEIDHSAPHPGLPTDLVLHFGVKRSLFLAMRRGEQTLGVLTAGRRHSATPFSPLEIRIAHGVAQFATLALQNLSLLESLRRANNLKSDFVATMSHELRTPLHILMGYADLMREGEFGSLNEEQLRILNQMDRSSHELLELINSTLDLSRLEAGRVRVDLSTFEIRSLFDEIAADYAPTHRDHPNTSLHMACPPDLPPLSTDRSKLKVVLKNLIGNAFKFTTRGRIDVTAQSRDGGIDFLVSDTGTGIAAEVQPIIFEAFQQGESSMTRSRSGVGLGLYIVRRLAGLLQGEARLVSSSPAGSQFGVWLPFPKAASFVEDDPIESRSRASSVQDRATDQEATT